MSRLILTITGLLIAAFLIAGPVAFALHEQNQMRNFHVVQDGVLYRSGEMTLSGLRRAIHDYGIKTVVSLRDASRQTDQVEEKYCKEQEIKFIRLPPRRWWAPVGPAPVEENVTLFREVMDDVDNYPVLVHCFAGIHRTGAFFAIYRMEHDHLSNAEALRELKEGGYFNIEDEWDVLGYLEEYKPTWRADVDPAMPATRKRPPAKPRKPR
jgi:protein tyrosine/serine phosphatase